MQYSVFSFGNEFTGRVNNKLQDRFKSHPLRFTQGAFNIGKRNGFFKLFFDLDVLLGRPERQGNLVAGQFSIGNLVTSEAARNVKGKDYRAEFIFSCDQGNNNGRLG